MTLALLPDAELIVTRFLPAQSEVAAIAEDRVYTEHPKTKTWPAVRVTRFSGSPIIDRPLHLDAAQLQIDAYAGPRSLSRRLAETCRASIAARLIGTQHDDNGLPIGVVTGAAFGELRGPTLDDSLTPSFHVTLFRVTLYLHP